jgi:hypothetical protein
MRFLWEWAKREQNLELTWATQWYQKKRKKLTIQHEGDECVDSICPLWRNYDTMGAGHYKQNLGNSIF